MKYLSTLVCLLFTVFSFSQEKTKEQGQPNTVAFQVIENAPIYSGCDKTLTNGELKACMSNKINTLISKNFNLDLANSLNLPAGRTRISIQFKVDQEGNVVKARARAPHPALEKEAIRLVNLIPKMDRPGIQKGKPVTVSYGLPIVFMIEAPTPKSKKE